MANLYGMDARHDKPEFHSYLNIIISNNVQSAPNYFLRQSIKKLSIASLRQGGKGKPLVSSLAGNDSAGVFAAKCRISGPGGL
jgi:hypothetical protein